MRIAGGLLLALYALAASPALADEHEPTPFTGPGKFCGYATIIQLQDGETISPGEGGIHGGNFVWEGEFGRLEVVEIGWAKPRGSTMQTRTAAGMLQIAESTERFDFVRTIWNGEYGVATFTSSARLLGHHIDAIGRVTLFNEGERPQDCDYIFGFGGFSE